MRSLLAALLLLAALPAWADQPGADQPGADQPGADQPGADPALTQTPDPALVKMVPPDVAKRAFTVAVALGSPPDNFRNEKGEMVGWETDLARAAVQSLGLELDLRPTTFDTLIPGLQSKRFDAAIGQMGVTAVREKVIDQIGWLVANELFAALADNPIKVDSLDDLCGVTVGTTRGSREMVFADEQQPKCAAQGKKPVNALAFNDGNGAVEAMMSRRSDLFWLGSTAVNYFVAQSKGRTKVVGSYTDRSYLGIGMPKGSDMAAPMQAALQHLIDNGTYEKVIVKWGLQDGAIKTVPLNPTTVAK